MLPRAPDRFDEWLRLPVDSTPSDPRFEVRRARPQDFDRVYDLVDEVFGAKRPRALFDWLYRESPEGPAQTWLVFEKQGGRLVCAGSRFPWPLARGERALEGRLVGDLVVSRSFQRQGIAGLRDEPKKRHPLFAAETTIGWPNPRSTARSRTQGRAHEVLGRTRLVACPIGGALGRLWRAAVGLARGERREEALRVEEMAGFEAACDAVTARTMAFPDYWSPHRAEFLEWRYRRHPTRSYRGLAALRGEALLGYAVVGTGEERAWLMELAAPPTGGAVPALLRAAQATAREAGCRSLAFHAPPAWRHWGALRAAGFVARSSPYEIFQESLAEPEASELARWQLVPGDCDTL